MAPTPPAAPANIKSRRSVGGSFNTRASQEPKPAPIWAIGPSWPAEPPVPMVMIDAIVLITGTRRSDHPTTPVESPDHGVGAMSLGLGCPGENQNARDQSSHGRNQDDQPPGTWIGDRVGFVFTGGRHLEVEQSPQDNAVHELQR